MLTLCVLLAGLAQAESPEAWASLHDGLLNQSMDRDPMAAIDSYEALLSGIPEGEPMRGDLLYWLGRARLASGDAAGAMETLGASKKVWSSRARARSLLGRLLAQKQAVRRIPYLQHFETSPAPWVRGWTRGQDSDLKISPTPQGRALTWQTEVRDGEEDFLTFAVATDGAPISELQMRLQAADFPAVIELHLSDAQGKVWRAPTVLVPAGDWTSLSLQLNEFIDLDEGVAAGSIRGEELRWVTLREVTSQHLEDRGVNRLLIDDLQLN